MGFFKKIFKPVAKVLDKVIPNEIKPALPYVAAFAPFMMPAGFGTGFASGLFKTQAAQQMAARALLGGGANVLGQLSQEGSEGDINLLSAGIGALSGAMTAPGAADTFRGMTTKGAIDPALSGAQQAKILADRGLLTKAADVGLTGLAKGSEMFAAGIKDPFSMKGLQAATVPAATATGDVMQAEARRLEKQQIIDDALAAAEALEDSGARAQAIRNAMSAYDFFTEQEIEDTIASAGYKAGGRVGFDNGGLSDLLRGMQGRESEETDTPNVFSVGDGIKIFIKDFENQPEITGQGMQGDGKGGMEEIFVLDDGSRITVTDYINKYGMPENRAKGGRVGFRFGGIDEAIEMVEGETVKKGKEGIMMAANEDPLLVEEYNKYVFDLLEQRPNAKPMSFQDFKRMAKAGMKDGGLMDLGGKEMDLRGGGFVPIGKKERADDVPARLSKNEFVMTADAVRAAGGGSVNKGAKRMYNLMNTLEARA